VGSDGGNSLICGCMTPCHLRVFDASVALPLKGGVRNQADAFLLPFQISEAFGSATPS
jgi:hypothetical protein